MKRDLQRVLLLSAVMLAAAACSKDEEMALSNSDNGANKPFHVCIEASLDQNEATKAAYESNGLFSWSIGDEISLCYGSEQEDLFTQFTTQESGKSVHFEGEMVAFDGERSILAYNADNLPEIWDQDFSDGINYEEKSAKIGCMHLYNYNKLYGDDGMPTGEDVCFSATGDISCEDLGLMVAAADGATATSESDYNIPALNFKQVASFFQFELLDIPSDIIISDVTLTPTKFVESMLSGDFYDSYYDDTENDLYKIFPNESTISFADGTISAVESYLPDACASLTSVSSNTYDPDNHFITIPLLPTNVEDDLSIMIRVTDKAGSEYTYYYDLATGINFKRNTIHRKEGLSLNDFEKFTRISVVALSEFDDPSFVPEGYSWIIDSEGDTDLSAADLAGVRRALSDDSLVEGDIELQFINILSLGDEALSGDLPALGSVIISSEHANITLGDRVFAGNKNLSYAQFYSLYESPDGESGLTTLGEGVFEGCSSLVGCGFNTNEIPAKTFKDCTSLLGYIIFAMPTSITSIGDSAFENCTSLGAWGSDSEATLELYDVQSIGARAFYNCNQLEVINYSRSSSDVEPLSFIGAEAFHCDAVGGGSKPYTESVVFNTDSSLADNISFQTLTIGSLSYVFEQIYIDGVEQPMDNGSNKGNGEDLDVEIL